MTNKEAIEELKKVDTLDMPARLCEAHYMAIKALEQEPKSDVFEKIRAEIDSHCSDNRDRNDGLYIAMKIIDKYRGESEDKE